MNRLALDLCSRMIGTPVDIPSQTQVTGFATDNREVKPGDLFIAIKGENVDGHDFAASAFANGATVALVERHVDGPHILVPSVANALADMARSFRSEYEGPVIGVTGSVGKTSAKEFIAAALSPLGKVAKTQGNRNSEWTGPLLWPEMDGSECAVVAEMGMRGFGQIAHLASFHQPTIAAITMIGHAHVEMVGSREGIVQAKTEIYDALPDDGLSIAWAEDDFIEQLRERAKGQFATFGFSEAADSRVLDYRVESWSSARCHNRCGGRDVDVEIPVVGRHMALNAALALLIAVECGVPLSDAAHALKDTQLPSGRMQALNHNGLTIVFDAYNASPDSFSVALETLNAVPSQGKKHVVMGQMRELGDFSIAAHKQVGQMIADAKPNSALFLEGGDCHEAYEAAQQSGLSGAVWAEKMDDVVSYLKSLPAGDTVLLKASRGVELERALVDLGVGEWKRS
ncbi:MAG: UDP-N-acetylmuramoyl-tripeptide--D-alanyl-D-alanine ligase [Fimbriimonadaceae bacterium]|nr:UDP-N-acetylmuramoyl-tripeptide--D-alanyl-D-alanine ligase [Fimbriimonadaceae bacterium]